MDHGLKGHGSRIPPSSILFFLTPPWRLCQADFCTLLLTFPILITPIYWSKGRTLTEEEASCHFRTTVLFMTRDAFHFCLWLLIWYWSGLVWIWLWLWLWSCYESHIHHLHEKVSEKLRDLLSCVSTYCYYIADGEVGNSGSLSILSFVVRSQRITVRRCPFF